MKKFLPFLISGDLLTMAIVTVIGFATHGETDLALLPRMLATFLPLALGWFLIAPWLGLFNPWVASNARNLWRPFAALVFAGPLAALLRAFWLDTVVIPIFGVVLSGSAGLGMVIWRAIAWYVLWKQKHYPFKN